MRPLGTGPGEAFDPRRFLIDPREETISDKQLATELTRTERIFAVVASVILLAFIAWEVWV